ncbi:MAG: cyclodeaminase/cyclohydrolase family protein [Ferrimicrobium sp.]
MSDSVDLPEYLDRTVKDFIDAVAEPKPAPAAGSVAAIAVSMAAALCVKSALLSTRQLTDANDYARAARELRDRANKLCQADATAYAEVILAQREERKQHSTNTADQVRARLKHAAQVSLDIANLGIEVGAIAAHLTEVGNPNLTGDGTTAALLAESGVRSATTLALVNLVSAQSDPNAYRLTELLDLAAGYRTRALESVAARSHK